MLSLLIELLRTPTVGEILNDGFVTLCETDKDRVYEAEAAEAAWLLDNEENWTPEEEATAVDLAFNLLLINAFSS